MQEQIDRASQNLQCAINQLGHTALAAANPVPWFRRFPVRCSLITGSLVAAGTLVAVRAFRHRKGADHQEDPQRPIHIFVKKPKPQSKGLGAQLATALIGGLSAKLTDSLRAMVADSFASERAVSPDLKRPIIPNPNLRDVEI